MPPRFGTTVKTLATLLIASFPPVAASEALPARSLARDLTATQRQRQSLTPPPASTPLYHSFKSCGKKWVKRAHALSQDKLAWMLQRDHRFYEVTANDRKLLTIEVLSTASFRNCDVEREWNKRETTIRVKYFLSDGTTAIKLHHFARDDIFFNQPPSIYAGMGRALLKGINVDGQQANRWLELQPLKQLLTEEMSRSSDPDVLPEAPEASARLRLASLRPPE